jgi:hypothetical protein
MAFRTNAGLLIKPAPRNPFVATTVASESHNCDWDPRHHLPPMLSSLRPGLYEDVLGKPVDDVTDRGIEWCRACEPFTGADVFSTDRRPFCPRTSEACSREGQRSASDNSSTKCSGLLLRTSLSIWAARRRHLFRAPSMPAFSVASSPPNSSDIMGSDISEPSPSAGWSPVERTRFNQSAVLEPLQSAVLEPLQSAQSAVLEPATEPSEKCADLRLPPVYQCGCPALTCGCPASRGLPLVAPPSTRAAAGS